MRFKELYESNCDWRFGTDLLLSIYGETEIRG